MSFKHKATSGFIWNAIEKFSGHLVSFVIGVTLERIFTLEDFGLMGMLVIFFVFRLYVPLLIVG
jgi:O-antigen/teichoic acid export membrane protein